MKKIDQSILVLFLLTLFSTHKLSAQKVIVIDPGHGYCDEAIHAPNYNHDGRLAIEMATAHSVGLKLRDLLQEECAGWRVYVTRTSNSKGSWISVTQRRAMSNSWGADRFISIHTNAGGGTGTETLWCTQSTPSSTSSTTYASQIQRQMVSYGDWRDRGVHEDDGYINIHLGVLNGNNALSCLNEVGFGDTAGDATKLGSDTWRKKFAEAYKVALSNSLQSPCSGGCASSRNFTSPISSGTYKTSGTIIASSNVVTGADVVFDAKTNITLSNGFIATSTSGTTFTAKVGVGCFNTIRLSDDLSDTTEIQNADLIKNDLLSIYPNPSSGEVNISFTATHDSKVSIKIFNTAGLLVDEISKNKEYTAGKHMLLWNASNKPSGIYFCTFQDEEGIIIKKLLINR
jgi:N-acetylmuramoyl-L-alanine amidase